MIGLPSLRALDRIHPGNHTVDGLAVRLRS